MDGSDLIIEAATDEVKPGEAGSSLVVVRTETGRRIVRAAMAAGYLELTPAEAWKVEASQKNLVRKKGAIWGRLLALRLLGLPVPQFASRGLFRLWLRLPLMEKIRCTAGTVRRVLKRGYFRPEPSAPVNPRVAPLAELAMTPK